MLLNWYEKTYRIQYAMVKNDISTQNINYELSSSNKNFVSANSGLDIKDLPNWLIKANFSRTETDLIATKSNSNEVIFLDFFTHHELPGIYTKNGLFLNFRFLSHWGDFRYFFTQILLPYQSGNFILCKLNL